MGRHFLHDHRSCGHSGGPSQARAIHCDAGQTVNADTTTLAFNETSYVLENPATRTEVKLAYIYGVMDGKDLGLIAQNGIVDTLTIPQTAFESEEHKQRCLAELTSLIQAAKAKTAP